VTGQGETGQGDRLSEYPPVESVIPGGVADVAGIAPSNLVNERRGLVFDHDRKRDTVFGFDQVG
jgi:hypothetical protein